MNGVAAASRATVQWKEGQPPVAATQAWVGQQGRAGTHQSPAVAAGCPPACRRRNRRRPARWAGAEASCPASPTSAPGSQPGRGRAGKGRVGQSGATLQTFQECSACQPTLCPIWSCVLCVHHTAAGYLPHTLGPACIAPAQPLWPSCSLRAAGPASCCVRGYALTARLSPHTAQGSLHERVQVATAARSAAVGTGPDTTAAQPFPPLWGAKIRH